MTTAFIFGALRVNINWPSPATHLQSKQFLGYLLKVTKQFLSGNSIVIYNGITILMFERLIWNQSFFSIELSI